MRFTLKQIAYFVAAAEAGSIAVASLRIHISPPSISAAIAALEAEFGFQLFIRHHAQGLSLTPQGQRFLNEARSLLNQAEDLAAAASELSTRVGGVLNIGCLSTLYPLVVPELLHVFRQRHPSVRVEALAGHHEELLARLRGGQISLVLGYDLGVRAPDIDFAPLATLPPFAFVSSAHPLADAGRVALETLAPEPFLLLDMPVSRDYFLALFHRAGLVPQIGGRFEHIEIIRSLVARGEGFGIANAPPRNRMSLDGHPLRYLRLEGAVEPLAHGVMTMKGIRATQTMEAFLALCRQLVTDRGMPGVDLHL
ncbi:LysR family transcriptional regulator [Zavarzinia sp. CC-PAN008]|uniref:LysR family transcriptional regulator n=1 Tax=Zavarzinia sp. CC-PAN008 TaxID=3243332 RepID=UPI003F74857B